MNNNLSCVAPPLVPSMDRPGVVVPTAEKFRDDAYKILNDKVQKLLTKYKDKEVDIVTFAHKVHKLGVLFRATIGLICTHDRDSALVESVTKLRLEPQTKLEEFLDSEVRRIEKLAQDAFHSGQFKECYTLQKPLVVALSDEKGSIRHFSLQSWVLASACNLEYIDEVVQLVTSLEEDVPDAHRNWFLTSREKVVSYIQARFAANELELNKVLEEAVGISARFDLVLKEAIDSDGQTADVDAVLQEFTQCGARLDGALKNHDQIHGWLESLKSHHKSVRDEVCGAFKLGNERCGLIHNLTETLAQKSTIVDQIDYLQNWLHAILESNKGEEFRSVETYALILLLQKCFTDGASDASLLKLLDAHGNKLGGHFTNINSYIAQQLTANEVKLKEMQVRLEAAYELMKNLFMKTHNDAQNVLEDLNEIEPIINQVDASFQPCKQLHVKVEEVTRRTGFEIESSFGHISTLLEHGKALAKETRALAVELKEELDVDSRHETYRTWIETHKDSFTQENPSLLHKWVVKMFLESYFSAELDIGVQQATEKFLQEGSEWVTPCIQGHQGYLDEEWKRNEDALQGVFTGVGAAATAVGRHLKAVYAHEIQNFETQLQAVISLELGSKDVLDSCVLLNGKLRFLHELAQIELPSGCTNVIELYERNSLLQARAKKLHDALVQAVDVNAKIEVVRGWMAEDINEYDETELSYIHKAALAMLDAYYFSPYLNEAQEEATNRFLQLNSNVLLAHLDPQKGLLQDRWQKNESELLEFARAVNTASTQMKAIFTTEGLTKDTAFQPLREKNKAVKLGTIEQLQVCQRLNGKLKAMYALLNMPFKSSCKDVSLSFDKASVLAKRAMMLLYGLSTAQASADDKMDQMQKALLVWIEKDLSLHEASPFYCTADELSYVHKWALCLLGRFYFSPDLSDDIRMKTVQLLRKNTKPLFSHLRAFGHDVKLSFAKHSLEMSLLVLATISCRLEKEYGSQEGVVQLLKPDEVGLLSRGFARLGFGSKEPEKSDKPLIDLDKLNTESISRVGNRDVILNYLLCAYQYYNISTLETLNAEDSVALFRICKLIEMPKEIAQDLKDLLQGKLEEKLVKPVLWLLLATALEINLPYATLQRLFKKISLEELHEWVLLYKSELFDRKSTDHYKLFFAVIEAVEHLFENKSQFTATEEIARTFTHVLEIYVEVLEQKFDPTERNKLDHRLIQLGCKAVERASDANVAQFANTRKVDGKDIRASITHLDSETLDELAMITKNPHVIRWLKENVVPNLQTLELKKSLHQFIDLGICPCVTKVSMPLKAENRVTADFKSRFPALQVVELFDGELSVKDIMALPLRSVTLKRIENVLDCSSGTMRNSVRTLVLEDVEVERDSLSWVAGCQGLEEISIKAKGDSLIGKLATARQVQEKQRLRSCSLQVKNLDADVGLKTSLPLLLDSHETLATLTLCSAESEESILDLLLQSKAKLTIQHLTISCNSKDVQKLGRLAEFTNLKSVCLRVDDKAIRTQIDYFKFEDIKLPKGLKITRADSKGNKVVAVYPKE